ncbi:hypothetical protein QUC31_004551 [Theobroma cacao]
MDKLVSDWCTDQSLPESYIFPPETRPGKLSIPSGDSIPVVDLGEASINRSNTIQKVLKASQDFGFFQVVNHGVSQKVLNGTMSVVKEFFEMPTEDKTSLYSEDPKKVCRLYTSNANYGCEKFHFWRDVLKHPCHPLEECIKLWPDKPTSYRWGPSSSQLRLHHFFFTFLHHIVSNNKLKSAEHRVVTNSEMARTTVGLFISSCDDSIIEPAKSLTNAGDPPLYRAFQYKDFISNYVSMMGDTELALQPFKLQFH